ncbi:MAG TPA: aromatic ring-hydroxylating dioxygenase subunit alpha, partial [Stellaceae bacterium]|nr:aromatic ring-hydroxylating dioxygenase subunit alpha [Stellaceae bacterium]
KPGETWTEKYPQLGTGLVSYESAISAEFYEHEREAVFRRNWLFVGRTEQVKKTGDYFTKELEVCKTSVIIIRGKDGKIRGFHNTCPHRGNKLLWQENPRRPVEGRCLRMTCKYHGLGFGLDGKVEVLTDRENWFGSQGSDLHLAEIPTEIWNGFIFINLTPGGPTQTLREHLGEFYWTGFDGYPFEELSEVVTLTGEANSNWKTLADAFAEGYHVPYLHRWSFPLLKPGTEITVRPQCYGLAGKHSFYIIDRVMDEPYAYEYEKLARATGAGSLYPFARDLSKLPPAANPTGHDRWLNSSHVIWPNMQIQFYWPGWFLIYAFWPLAYNRMRFDVELHYLPSRNFSEMYSHKVAMQAFMDAALQDVNTLEATQLGLEARAFEHYPLSDGEFIVRRFHKTIYAEVAAYRESLRAGR